MKKKLVFYLNRNIETNKDIEDAGNDLLKKGINNIVITLGSKGVYFVNAKEKYYVDALKLKYYINYIVTSFFINHTGP